MRSDYYISCVYTFALLSIQHLHISNEQTTYVNIRAHARGIAVDTDHRLDQNLQLLVTIRARPIHRSGSYKHLHNRFKLGYIN